MAGGGVGEAMLIGAAVGAGTGGVMSAVQDKDVGQGMLLGALGGAATGGIGSGIGGAAGSAAENIAANAAANTATDVAASTATDALANAAANTAAENTVNTLAQQGANQAATSMASAPALSSTAANINTTGIGNLAAEGASQGAQTWGQQGIGRGLFPGMTNAQVAGASTTGGISGLLAANGQPAPYQAPGTEPYNGPLSKFKMAGPSLSQYNYDPNTFRPSIAPGFADGGIASIQTGMFPQSQMDRTQFATPSQMPVSREIIASDYDQTINPYTGDLPRFADGGGIADLGSYSDGGRLLRGPGDGMSDNIPASIGGKQPARLADGEFVVPADVVSHLGNGSTDAGAKTLYSMMDKVRKARTGNKKQGKEINANKYIPGMASGGDVKRFASGGDPFESLDWTAVDELASSDQAAQNTVTPAAVAPVYNPSVYNPTTYNYSAYTQANRPSGNAPQYYGDIYKGSYPDYSTPGYTLTGGSLGQWNNVAGESARAAQPASMNQQITQDYLRSLGRAPDTSGFNYWMNSGLTAPQIAKAIGTSDEAKAISAPIVDNTPTNNAAYINSLYNQYVGRAPEESGSSFWQKQLAAGVGQQDIINAIKNSPEAQAYAQKTAEKTEEKKRRGGIASLA